MIDLPIHRTFTKTRTKHANLGPGARLALRQLPLWTTLVLSLFAFGCEQQKAKTPEFRQVTAATSDSEDFNRAFDLIEKLDEFEPEQAMAQAAYHLNRWVSTQRAPKDWIRDPLIDRTLGKLGDLRTIRNLADKKVTQDDIRFLQEATWLRDVSTRVSQSVAAPDVVELLNEMPADLDVESKDPLAVATKLFDWTIRNVQLDASPEPPTGSDGNPISTLQAAQEGLPGVGYMQQPWEVMLFGHGDAWQRARVFILLARQRGLNAVVLAVRPQEATTAPRLWALGVVIKNDLYLFDPTLGLPLPRIDGKGIATLANVLDEPKLLDQLDPIEELKYPVRGSDLANVTALIDGSSEALSQRMKIVEERLTGDQRMILTVSPSQVAEAVQKIRGVREVRIWAVPLEAELYAAAQKEIRRNDSKANSDYMRDRLLFSGLSPLLLARQLYFRGRFERADDKPGSLMKYMEARLPESELEALLTSKDVQKTVGIIRERTESDEVWNARLRFMQAIIREGKDHASYWIGLVHFENGDYDDAANWFGRRTLEASTTSRWLPGARYNLARSYEALGKYNEARSTYLLDESPQRHGNLLRARRIRLTKLQQGEAAE